MGSSIKEKCLDVINGKKVYEIIKGDIFNAMDKLPDDSLDCIITSPPYWKMREYKVNTSESNSLIGQERTPQEYVEKIRDVFSYLKSKLKKRGSLWLNLGDKYNNKNLVGLPWRVAIALQEDGWILRNDIIWYQMKGTQSVQDRLRMVHEHLFHFVKQNKYYYDDKSIRIKPNNKPKKMNNGDTISATGVSGRKYRDQIEKSTVLTESQRRDALRELNRAVKQIEKGEINDFRMTIKGKQRTLHGDSENISGRARELQQKGFYIMKSKSEGYMPNDIWQIPPEDAWRRDSHCAVFPTELLQTPIKATCPEGGIVMDPFLGTGTTIEAAVTNKRKALGVEISTEYVNTSKERLHGIHAPLKID